MKLRKFLASNIKQLSCRLHEEKNKFVLDHEIAKFFPSEDFAMESLNWISLNDKQLDFVYNASFLPFHTRDDNWLACYVKEVAKHRRNRRVDKIEFDDVLEYVKTSPKFDALRCEYEGNIIKGFINDWLNEPQPNSLVLPSQEKINARENNENFDVLFRNDVIKSMNMLGMRLLDAEMFLEKNRDLWFGQVLRKTFFNQLETSHPSLLNKEERIALSRQDPYAWEDFVNKEFELLNLWMMDREYKYYQNHRPVIDAVGTATENMKISASKALDLNCKLQRKTYEYIDATCNNQLLLLNNQEQGRTQN